MSSFPARSVEYGRQRQDVSDDESDEGGAVGYTYQQDDYYDQEDSDISDVGEENGDGLSEELDTRLNMAEEETVT